MKSQIAMFELPDIEEEPVIEFRSIQPIWTENKARLIQRYLKLFIHITKHGTYIDGFAGPQYLDKIDAWSAKLVLQIEPKWLGKFLLCDNSLEKYAHLNELRQSQPPNKKGDRRRDIKLWNADFNQIVVQMLDAGSIDENTAAFCLLDQHTFECRWETLVRLAEYKKQRKIEPASCITSRRILHMPSIPRHRLVLRIRSPSRCAQRRERRLCGVCVVLIRVMRTHTHRWARRALHSRDGRALSQEIYATFG